ncbi:hypothetical protein [Hoeflea sp.]|uniref:hypothetical protein n=1 Tax=Hoeflea sp. TaxID=1940281 RepID=UPI003BB0C968
MAESVHTQQLDAHGPGKAVKAAAKYTALASKGANKLKAYSDAAKKLRDANKELSDLETIAADLKYISKIATALEVASAGFAALSALLPVPTIDDQILDQVRENFGAIEGLSKDLNTDFKHLSNGQKITAKVQSLNDGTRSLRTGRDAVRVLETQPDNAAALADLDSLDIKQLDDAFTAMLDAAKSDLLSLLYQDTYGELAQMQPVLSTLTEGVELFIMLRSKAQAKKDGATDDAGRAAAAKAVGDAYHDRIATIDKTVADWLDKITDMQQSHKQICNYITTEKEVKDGLNFDNLQASSDNLQAKVTAKYPYLAVSALVTVHRKGLGWHVFHYPKYQTLMKFSQKDKTNTTKKKLDVLVTWRPRFNGIHGPQTQANLRALEDTPDAERSDTQRGLAIASTMVNIYDKHTRMVPNSEGKLVGMIQQSDARHARDMFLNWLNARFLTQGASKSQISGYAYACIYLPLSDSIGFTAGTHCAYSHGPGAYAMTPRYDGRYWQFAFWI